MRNMRNSKISYVGEIPSTWEMHPVYYYFCERKHKNSLGEEKNLLSLSYGKIIEKDINKVGGLLPETFNTYNIVEPGDIIIRPTDLQNDKRSLRTGLVRQHGIITSAYIDLMPIRDINTRYYHYLLYSFDVMKVFYNMGNGVRQGLNFSEFSRLMIFEPGIEEQDAIADYLDSKCAKIDSIKKNVESEIEMLEQYKRSVITEAVTQGLDKNVKMKDSRIPWIGKIPKSWKICKIGFFSNVTKLAGFEFTEFFNYEENGSVIVIRGINLKNIKLDLTHIRTITKKISDMLPRSKIELNDILISYAGSVGNIAIMEDKLNYYHLGPNVGKIHIISSKLHPRYTAYYLTSHSGQEAINILKNKNAQESISMENIRKIKITVPPINEQDAIIDFLDAKCARINSIIQKKQELLANLDTYKNSLIYEYVTGKKEVPAV